MANVLNRHFTREADGQQADEDAQIISHHRNSDQNCNEVPLHTY